MIRGNTANFDDAHAAFLAAAQQEGLQVVKDMVLDKNASSSAALQAGGGICADRANAPQAMYPLIGPTIWVQIVAGAYPDVNYANTRFGGTAVHVLKLNCGAQRYDTEATFKSSFGG